MLERQPHIAGNRAPRQQREILKDVGERIEAVGRQAPATETVPPLGCKSPPRMPSKVDLPQPEGPTMARISPCRMVKPMSSSTDSVPYRCCRPETTSSKDIQIAPIFSLSPQERGPG